jgi:hypothetical protein
MARLLKVLALPPPWILVLGEVYNFMQRCF